MLNGLKRCLPPKPVVLSWIVIAVGSFLLAFFQQFVGPGLNDRLIFALFASIVSVPFVFISWGLPILVLASLVYGGLWLVKKQKPGWTKILVQFWLWWGVVFIISAVTCVAILSQF